MFMRVASAAAIAVLVATGAAAAGTTNDITISRSPLESNALTLALEGSGNVLSIGQTAPLGTASPNSMVVSVTGDLNGGGAAFTGAALLSGLQPGSLMQDGEGNMMALSVIGSQNLFAMVQKGSFNAIDAHISGAGNQAAVIQAGMNNHLAFSQSGTGNIISVSQTSW
jgi:hypothetical protein